MSTKYPGGFITKNPTAPTSSAAPGVWTIEQAAQYIKAGAWPSPPAAGTYWMGKVTNASSTNVSPTGIVQDSSGNIYTTGFIVLTSLKIYLVKFNSAGVIQWQKSLDNGSTCFGFGVALDASNNVYVSGFGTFIDSDAFIAKYNSSGALQWQRRLYSNGADGRINNITLDSSANIYAAGYTGSASLFAKYDTSGALQWQKQLTSVSGVVLYSAQVDSTSANVYVVGNYENSTYFGVVAKYNSAGTVQWQRSLGTSGLYTTLRGVALDSSNNVYVVGFSGVGFGAEAIVVAKYNSSGVLQWQRTLNSTNPEVGTGIATDSSGNSYICCTQTSTNDVYILAKYDSAGGLQWQRSISNSGGSLASGYNSISLDASSRMYLSGVTTSGSVASQFFCKLPGDGSYTGTFALGGDNYVYTPSSLTDAAGTLTDAAGALTEASSTLTDAATTLTDTTTSSTAAITNL